MKTINKMELTTRLLLVFFAAVFLLSVCHFFVYGQLLSNMEREEDTSNAERMNTAAVKLNIAFQDVRESHREMLARDCYKYMGSLSEPYTLAQMHRASADTVGDCAYIGGYLVMFSGTDHVVNDMGCDSAERYFERYYKSDDYSLELWKSGFWDSFSTMYYPAAEFTGYTWRDNSRSQTLMPLMLKAYWDNSMVTVLFLDVDKIFEQEDAYLREGMYLFSEGGTLLCTSDEIPLITAIPQEDNITLETGESCKVVHQTAENGMIYVKLLPQTDSAGLLQTSVIFCIVAAGVSLIAVVILFLPTVKRTLQPVNNMLNLLHQHGQLQNPNDLHGAHDELENIITSILCVAHWLLIFLFMLTTK